MSNVFFGKMNVKEQVESKIYKTANKSYLGNISEGDYAFIKYEKEDPSGATVKRLWKLRKLELNNNEYIGTFEEVFNFNPIQLAKFEALSFFQLDVNLLNKCNKPTKGLSFYQLTLVDEDAFTKAISSKDNFNAFISNKAHYRTIDKFSKKDDINPASINVQLYKDNDSWCLYDEVSFIGQDLKDNFDSKQFDLFEKFVKNGKNTAKKKMFDFLNGMQVEVPMMGLWDLFCGSVKENNSSSKKQQLSQKRINFIEYCKKNGVTRAASQYESGIRAMEKELEVNADNEFVRDECKELKKRIESHIKDISEEQLGYRKNWEPFLSKFIDYKKAYLETSADEKSIEQEKVYSSYDYSQAKYSGYNKVFYGTPGCGKSYYVENTILPNEEIDNNNVVRTTFYQDYTNSDFVGQILPQIEGEKVTYKFIPGPFTIALKNAIDNPDEKVALIIEELNRGNAPNIFGDIFQLLDRESGTSRYPIVNTNVQNFLKEECTYDFDYIKIPANLYIYATMNTSDQNVYTLDTAFKRRWKFEKITNDFLGKDTIGGKFIPGLKDITWKKFVETINKHIVSHATSLSAEDKQLGKYFVSEDLLLNTTEDYSDEVAKDFAYKVFEYLWSDVAKFNRSEWFVDDIKSLDILIYKFLNHENIFVLELSSSLPIYIQPDEEE